MTEQKKNILITSLGLAPGVVTTAIDVLQKNQVEIDKVITLSTRGTEDRVEFLTDVFRKPYYRNNNKVIIYESACISFGDLSDNGACEAFFRLANQTIDKYNEEGWDVYVSLAGGRKSMSGILAISTQFFGAKMLFHIAIIKGNERKDIDAKGNNLDYIRTHRDAMLHPGSSELVELPFLNLRPFTKSEDMKEINEFFEKYRVNVEPFKTVDYDAGRREQKRQNGDITGIG